jgi:RNA polymerase sigma-70 factor (ECF subfamily)
VELDPGAQPNRDVFLNEALPHTDALYRMALRNCRDTHLAQDYVQETYKEAWKSFKGYQPGTNCKAWLFKILFRVTQRDSLKNRPYRNVALDEIPETKLMVVPSAQEAVERKEILSSLDRMPQNYRTVLVLADVESLSYREISETLGIPLGTVMSRLSRARRLLSERIPGHMQSNRSA